MLAMQRLFQVIFCAGLLAVAYLSLQPRPPEALLLADSDWLTHLAGYGALGVTAGLGWPHRVGAVMLLVFLCGFALELGQIPVPGRGFEWSDVLANTLGALLGVLASRMMRRIFPPLLRH